MNLLVTNAQEVQAYTIIRSLRQYSNKVVITTGGRSVRVDDFPGMAFYSRFVDKHYTVPHFADDWAAGKLSAVNTLAEEAYVRRIEQVCQLEKIDAIVPSLDPEVYLFAKNKSRLEDQGITVVVQEPEIVARLTDKARTLEVAGRVGFPVPVTHYPNSLDDIEDIICNYSPAWVVKSRVGAHLSGVSFAANAEALRRIYLETSARQADPLIQQYIPGLRRCHYYITVDHNHEIMSLLQPKPMHVFADGVSTSIKSAISDSDGPLLDELRDLVKELRLWGGFTVQTKVDPTDNLPRLLEINPRLGHHLWFRTGLGVNEPLICLRLARHEEPNTNLEFPKGVALLDPYHDLFYFMQSLMHRPDQGPENSPQSPMDLLRLHRRQYLNRRPKVLCPQFQHILDDPQPCIRSYAFKISGRLYHPAVAALKKRLSVRRDQVAR